METLHFNVEPTYLVKQIIQIVYENIIDQFRNADFSYDEVIARNIRIHTGDFFTHHLTDEFINDEIIPELIKKEVTVLDNTPEHFSILWSVFIHSPSYVKHLNSKPLIDSGVFDKQTHKQYYARYGEHFLAITKAVQKAGIADKPLNEIDNYVMNNLVIVGQKIPCSYDKEWLQESIEDMTFDPQKWVIHFSKQAFNIYTSIHK